MEPKRLSGYARNTHLLEAEDPSHLAEAADATIRKRFKIRLP